MMVNKRRKKKCKNHALYISRQPLFFPILFYFLWVFFKNEPGKRASVQRNSFIFAISFVNLTFHIVYYKSKPILRLFRQFFFVLLLVLVAAALAKNIVYFWHFKLEICIIVTVESSCAHHYKCFQWLVKHLIRRFPSFRFAV